jgi:Mu-like prophage I protein
MTKILESTEALHRRMVESGRVEKFTAALFHPITPANFAEKSDGTARIQQWQAGLADMEDEDWRQFEVTPANARAMVEQANAAIASGKKYLLNYAHTPSGKSAGEVARFELDPDGSIWSHNRWTDAAKAGIKSVPPEWYGFSSEFYGKAELDAKGKPVKVNGRTLIRPFKFATGGALTNRPSMNLEKIAAQAEGHDAENESTEKENTEMETLKKFATKLGLDPEKATAAEVEAGVDALKVQVADMHVRVKDAEAGGCKGCGAGDCPSCAKGKAELEETVTKVVRSVFGPTLTAAIESAGKEFAANANKAADERHAKLERRSELKRVMDAASGAGKFTTVSRASFEAIIGPDADPKLIQAHVKTLPKIAPTGRIYTPSDEIAVGSDDFSDLTAAELEEPETRERFAAAVQKLVTKEKIDITEASARLLGTN